MALLQCVTCRVKLRIVSPVLVETTVQQVTSISSMPTFGGEKTEKESGALTSVAAEGGSKIMK